MASHERAGMSWWLCGRVSPRRLAVPCPSLLWARCAVPLPLALSSPLHCVQTPRKIPKGCTAQCRLWGSLELTVLLGKWSRGPPSRCAIKGMINDRWSVIRTRALWVPVVKDLCSIRTLHSNQCLGKLYNLIPVMYSVTEILLCHQHTNKNHSLSLFVNQLFGPQDIPSCGNSVGTVIGDWK